MLFVYYTYYSDGNISYDHECIECVQFNKETAFFVLRRQYQCASFLVKDKTVKRVHCTEPNSRGIHFSDGTFEKFELPRVKYSFEVCSDWLNADWSKIGGVAWEKFAIENSGI